MAKNTFLGVSGDWASSANWSSGAAPVATEDIYLTGTAQAITTNLDQHSIAPNSLNVYTDFTGLVASSGTYLQLGAGVTNIGVQGQGTGQGSRRLNLDLGSTTATVNVLNTPSSPADAGQAPVRILGSSLTINLTGGIISVAATPTETATITLLDVAGANGSPRAYIGPGAILTELSQTAGTVTTASTASIPNATVSRSSLLVHTGTGGFGTITIGTGATCDYDGTGTVSLLQLYGVIDLSGGGGAVTFTHSTYYSGAQFIDPMGRAVFTNAPVLSGCSQKDVKVDLGIGRKW